MRHPVAQKIAAASGNDGRPALGIGLEHAALERIDLVADEYGDGHGSLLGVSASQPSRLIEPMLRLRPKCASRPLRQARRTILKMGSHCGFTSRPRGSNTAAPVALGGWWSCGNA